MNTYANPILTDIREGTRFLRSVATLVIVVFGFVMYSPSVFAIVHSETPKENLSAKERYENSFEVKLDALDQALDKLNRTLNNQKPDKHIGSQSWFTHLERIFRRDDVVEARLAVTEAWEAMDDRHEESVQSKEEIEERYPHINDPKVISKLVEKVLENQRKAAEKHAQYRALVTAITEADDIKALKKASYKATKHIASYRAAQPKHIYNSGEMPFGVSSDATRSPYSRADMLHFYLGLDYDPELVHADVPVNPSTDYSPTTDVQITQEIRDLATDLGNDPKRIYNWVYNNIYYIPSFGSIQGSVQTLHNRAGNAFDISSLLIALLRASDIPARYVYGVAKFSADQVNNWVGGVDDIQSARVLMAQGGVPNSAVSYGGRFEELKIEHVWVESYGNFQPSGEYEWIPLDAAFKQYTFTEGMDLLSEVNFDQEAFQETVESAGIVNEAEGWISDINSDGIKNNLQQLQVDIANFIENLDPDTRLAEVIGGKSIIQRSDSAALALPDYEVVIRSRSFSELPTRLRHAFRIELERSGLLGGGVPLLNFDMSLPELAGKELSISFRPASAADDEIVDGLFGDAVSVEDIPLELPKGVFDVVGEVTVNGELVARTAKVEFGDLLVVHKGFDDPRFGYRKTTSPITAGDYQAIGINLHGVTTNQARKMLSKFESTLEHIETNGISDVTKHDVTGKILHAGMLSYFAVNDIVNQMNGRMMGLVHYRMPSFGTFSTYLRHGGATSGYIRLGSMIVDVDWMMSNNEGKVNCWQDWVDFNRMSGRIASAYEHIIPEKLLSSDQSPVEFVSTIKALQIANTQGQRIYTITSNNVDSVLDLIDVGSEVKNDIRNAISNGDVAIIHQEAIDYQEFYGYGYILVDLETGSGAYKISGGGNGAQLGVAIGLSLSVWLISIMILAATTGAFPILAVGLFWVSMTALLLSLIQVLRYDLPLHTPCIWTGLSLGFFHQFSKIRWIPADLRRYIDTIGEWFWIFDGAWLPSVEECMDPDYEGNVGGR